MSKKIDFKIPEIFCGPEMTFQKMIQEMSFSEVLEMANAFENDTEENKKVAWKIKRSMIEMALLSSREHYSIYGEDE